ncbi:hypothetical protein [Litoribacter populi]|uniref:hypothetical protein n=1 Tax=Litoribacter populi TaxID=2598460 RepID=UPI00117D7DB6|nr:hypothetical protein [Litoribacter populi]
MHSPFGFHYQVCKLFGWTMHEVLWKVPRAQIMLMIADQPGFVKADKIVRKASKKDLDGLFGL